MNGMKLSDRAIVLLKIVDEATDKDWASGKLSRYFVPQPPMFGTYFFTFRGKKFDTMVSGSGDANALKGLERKGLIERPRNCPLGPYCYAITEEGRILMESDEVRQLFEST